MDKVTSSKIKLKDWYLLSQEDIGTSIKGRYRGLLVGSDNEIDQRTQNMHSELVKEIPNHFKVHYSVNDASLSIGNSSASVLSLNELKIDSDRLLIDSTSMGFPDLLYTMQWASVNRIDFDLIYSEPHEYEYVVSKNSPKRIFELSEDGAGMIMLPSFALPLNESRVIVSLGFEGHRFGGLMESDEFIASRVTGLIGIPAYTPGWEIRALEANWEAMQRATNSFDANFDFAGANDPLANYEAISKCHQSEKGKNPSKRMPILHLVPFGTKPASIAMAWYAINNQGIGIIYDFLQKRKDKTKGIRNVHIWSFKS